MAIKVLPYRTGFIGAAISNVATVLPVDTAFLGVVAANVNFATDHFYLTLVEDAKREEVKVTGSSATTLTIVRAQGGTTAQSFSLAAKYTTELEKAAIIDIAAGSVPVSTVNITGLGIATITNLGGGNWQIDVPQPVVVGASGIEATAAFPNYTVALVNNGGCCEGEIPIGGAAGVTSISGGGIVTTGLVGQAASVTVAPPVFTGVGMTITGAWPNFTFTATGVGVGTVTSVAVGPGLGLTGNPNVNPTIAISPTGVIPATYGGVGINDRGQITVVPTTFNPVSVITAGTGLQVARTGDAVTISAIVAGEGVVGVVALADADFPLDTTNITTAVTPKLLADVVAAIDGGTAYGGQSWSGEADADYTVTVPTSVVTLNLVTGDNAIVFGSVTMRDSAAPATQQNYGIALFNGSGVRLHANVKIVQNQQHITCIIPGPFVNSVVLKTTALPAGAAIISHALTALKV